jgi:DNA polymerase I-like protein with 3'-5' exonuclease and polymerase domains
MRILVNYEAKDQAYIPILQYHLKARNIQAIATTLALTIGELIMKAKNAQAEAILICNTETLRNCVESPKATLDLYRGSLLRFSVPAIVCNSLQHTQTVAYGGWLLGKDLDKFKSIKEELAEAHKFSFTLLDTYKDQQDALHVLSQAACIAYDIETKTIEDEEKPLEGGETIITCASYTAILADNSLRTFVLPLVDFLEDHWKKDNEYAAALLFLRKANALPVPKVMHNGLYDCLHSITYHAEPIHWTLDTMAMAHSHFSELPKSLDFVASITLTDYLQWKTDSEEASRKKDINQYWGYNGKDTWYTARILQHYLRYLPPYARKNYSLQFPLVYPSLYCAFEGIKIDQDKRTELRTKAETARELELAKLKALLGDPSFNPASPKQVKTYIYDILGAADPRIGQRKDAKTGRRSRMERGTDSKNLTAIGEQHPILLRITDAILNYRENAKAISTYFDFKQRSSRLLWSLNPFGTDTGRMSCSSSSFWCGTQVQNIPPYAKDMLVADEGYTLIEIDNSQSEARCTAYLSKEYNLVKALEDPEKDFYKSLGTLFFGIPYENVTKEFRNAILKKIVHGTNYMMGAKTFIENAGVQNLLIGASHLGRKITLNKKAKADETTLQEFATELLESYHKPFPRVREWYKEIATDIATRHMLSSPLGYTRYFFGDINKDHNMLRGAVAHSPQNLSVAILNIGMMKVWKLVKQEKNKVRMKAQIHDSVFLQIKDEYINSLLPVILHLMDNGVEIHGRVLRIPVDYKIGKSWASMKEVKPSKG